MPRRDPRTGKYVSSSEEEMPHVFVGRLGVTVPAADLSGGTTGVNDMKGENGIVIDFSDELNSDEVFEVKELSVMATLGMPTTATAESSAWCDWVLRSGFGDVAFGTPSFYTGNTQKQEGELDLTQGSYRDDSILALGHLEATNSIADSVNGLAAGADHHRDRQTLPVQYQFDSDDEMAVALSLWQDNISDHAIIVGYDVRAAGEILEL